VRRTGVAAILAGALYFAGQAGELIFASDSGVAGITWVGLGIGGFIALGVALWGLRRLIEGTRPGRIGMRVALAGFGFLVLFSIQLVIELVRTGDIPNNFLLFAIGLLLVLVGQLLFAHDLRARLGRAWLLPIVGVVGLVAALTGGEHPIHDVGLFVFEGAWVALGVATLRADRGVRSSVSEEAVPA
jgi:hypothetical protein